MNNIELEIMTDAATGGGIRLALVRAVEDASGLPWDVARLTWRVTDMEEDEHAEGECVCGQTGLRYLYTIADDRTGAVLYPIGSDCIAHFAIDSMTDEVRRLRDLWELAGVVGSGTALVLKGAGRHLSRAKLAALYGEGAFKPSRWNGGDPARDLDFLLKMFGKRNAPSTAQRRKIDVLLSEIAGFLSGWAQAKADVDVVPDLPPLSAADIERIMAWTDSGVAGGIPPAPVAA